MTGAHRAAHRATAAASLAFGLAVRAGPAFAQHLGQAAETGPPVWRVIAALLLCLALAVGAALALRLRLRGSGRAPQGSRWRLPLGDPAGLFAGPSRRLQLVERLRLNHQVDVCLFRCDERHFIVAATPQGATVLASDIATSAAAGAP